MRLPRLVLAALLLLPLAAHAQAPPLLDRELFFGNPQVAGGQISPDGRYLTFTRPHEGVMNLWVKGVDEPFEAARLLTADERPVFSYFWTPDARYVLYVQDKGGDENFHVFRIDPTAAADPATGAPPATNLTPADGARAFIYSVPRDRPGVALVGLNDRDRAWHDLYEVELSTGERTLLVENDRQITGWTFDHAGRAHLASRTDLQTGGTEILRVREGTLGETVYTCSVTETCGAVRLHPDGRQAYLMTNRGDRDLTEFVLLDLDSGRETLVERDPEGEVDFAGAVFSNLTNQLQITYYIGDRIRLYAHDGALSDDLAFLRQRLPDGDVLPGSRTRDERTMLVSVNRDVEPGAVYVFDRDARTVERLYTSRPDLPTEHLAEMRPIRYEARDGTQIPAYLTLPKGVPAQNLPVVVFPHGGPWARDIWGFDRYAQFLANRGYAVLQPNFRGSTGFGKAFLDAGNQEWGTGIMQHDLTDGVQYLVEEGIADPARVGIAGISYGGYATLAGLAFTPDLYAAGVSIVGPSNLITLLNSIPPYWEAVRQMFHERMGDPATPEGRALLEAQSPVFHADRIRSPLLVIQGANDPRVVQHESDQIVVALRDRGFPVQYIVAPDEGHGFRDELNQLAMITAMEGFLAEHLGGRRQEEVRPAIAERLAALTVDPATVTLREAVDASGLEAVAFDGARLAPETATYRAVMQVMGQEITLEQRRTVEAADAGGRAAWRITSEAELMGQPIRDVFYVDRATLRPLSRSIQQGPQAFELTYGDDAVTVEAGGSQVVRAEHDGVAADGAAFEVGLGTLPLAEGYAARLAIFDMMQGGVKQSTLTVIGRETVTVPAGTFETFVVEVQPSDGSAAAVSYVSAAAPHVVVKQVSPLPAQMGGGTVTSELTAHDGR